MARSRPLCVVVLLLSLSQFLAAAAAADATDTVFNYTGCDPKGTKVCFVDNSCFTKPKGKEGYEICDKENDFKLLKDNCTKYLVIEPGVDHFIFEIMSSDFGAKDTLVLRYNHDVSDGGKKTKTDSAKMYFSCKNHKSTTGRPERVKIKDEDVSSPHAFCRFKLLRSKPDESSTFFKHFQRMFVGKEVTITGIKEKDKSEKVSRIPQYNDHYFQSRVPCNPDIFMPPGIINVKVGNEEHKEHIAQVNVEWIEYICPTHYTMMYKNLSGEFVKATSTDPMKCDWGEIKYAMGDKEDTKEITLRLKHSAKCTRPPNSLCKDPCTNCTGYNKEFNNDDPSILKCISSTYIVVNQKEYSSSDVQCSEESTPDKFVWRNDDIHDVEINHVECVDELDCNILDHIDFDTENLCDKCNNVNFTAGSFTCPEGTSLTLIETDTKINSKLNLDVITCNKQTGKFNYGDADHSRSSATKLSCVGGKPKKKPNENETAAKAAFNATTIYVSCGVSALIALIIVLVLIWLLCCRKKKQKEEPKTTPSTAVTTTSTKMESSTADIPSPAPLSPEPPEPDNGPRFSGQRVQMINCSKEKLREIEPNDEDPNGAEYSARDKTDSDKSQQQVTTEAPTFTSPAPTEKTRDQSKTVGQDESDARGDNESTKTRNSTVGDRTTDAASAASKKGKEKKKDGPRVEFRERVSYEGDTKSHASQSASMHTAPEQQRKDSSSNRVNGSSAPKKGSMLQDASSKTKEKTKRTQNTKDEASNNKERQSTIDDSAAPNRSKSRNTDLSRTC